MNPDYLSRPSSTKNPIPHADGGGVNGFNRDPYSPRPFEGLEILDVGCGGSILSEPLARLGADVTGIDAVEKNINIARVHAASDPLTSLINYSCTTAEDLVKENKKFDAVISLEVIDHVANPSDFCKSLAALAVPKGAVVMSTINRTMRAYATTIVGFVFNPLAGNRSLSDNISVNFITFGIKESGSDSEKARIVAELKTYSVS
ncbi:hypothetical protein LUZ61_021058 [Rhynchospora tenuis]|uniref:Methyltransferase type 11 domain-containing protein n=1 Tax=Rhynchospora tenuis TaxID=198213 RepID=A0AAD6EPE7_9POAL|nr:hypothetical protein LUZ61_021058 [Rhynchospora tenuis]